MMRLARGIVVRRAVLLLLPLVLAACAYLGATRPVAPFSIPLPASPEQFRWTPFKWSPGTMLTYQAQQFMELSGEGRQRAEGFTGLLSLVSQGQTAKGLTRVEGRVNGQPFSSFLFDTDGQLADAETVDPKSADDMKAMLQWMPFARRLSSDSLRINTPSEAEIFAAEAFPPRLSQLTSPVIHVTLTYQGFRRIGEQDVAVIAAKANLIVDPFDRLDKDGNPVTFESWVYEETLYLNPTHGYVIASYSTSAIRWSSSTKGPGQILLVESATLDRGRSQGLPPR